MITKDISQDSRLHGKLIALEIVGYSSLKSNIFLNANLIDKRKKPPDCEES